MTLYEMIKYFDYFNFLGTEVVNNDINEENQVTQEINNIDKHIKNIVSLEKELHEYFKKHNIKYE